MRCWVAGGKVCGEGRRDGGGSWTWKARTGKASARKREVWAFLAWVSMTRLRAGFWWLLNQSWKRALPGSRA